MKSMEVYTPIHSTGDSKTVIKRKTLGLGLVLVFAVLSMALICTFYFKPSYLGLATADDEDGSRETHVATEDLVNPATLYDIMDPEIVCLDNSSHGRYYLRKSLNNKTSWVIRFRAGPNRICYDDESCEMVYGIEGNTVLPEKDEIDPDGGIMSGNITGNPNFWDWNHVQPHFCSYDLWLGNDNGTAAFPPYRYNGHQFVQTLIKELFEYHDMGSADMILIGGIENAMALYGNLNWIADYIHSFNDRVTVLAFMDSNYFIEWPYTEDYHGFHWAPEPLVDHYGFDRWDAEVDAECGDGESGYPASCLNADTMMNYFSVPVFVMMHMFGPNMVSYYYEDYQDEDNLAEYANNLAASMSTMPAQWGCFVSQCTAYSISDNQGWTEMRVKNYTGGDALHEWIAAGERRNVRIKQDDCGYPDCEDSCDYERPFYESLPLE